MEHIHWRRGGLIGITLYRPFNPWLPCPRIEAAPERLPIFGVLGGRPCNCTTKVPMLFFATMMFLQLAV